MTQDLKSTPRFGSVPAVATYALLAGLLAAALTLPIMHLTLRLEQAIRDVFAAAPGDVAISPDMVLTLFRGAGYDLSDVRFRDSYSVLGGIKALFAAGHWVPATLLGLFSVVLPILKLGLRMAVTFAPDVRSVVAVSSRLDPFTKWALLDVLAVAVLLLSLAMTPGTQTSVGPAFGVFLLYIIVFVQSGRWHSSV